MLCYRMGAVLSCKGRSAFSEVSEVEGWDELRDCYFQKLNYNT